MLNQKPGQPGGPPRTKQYTTANTCPIPACPGGAVLVAQPPSGNIASWWSRCQRCLAYWETSPGGQIVALTVVPQVELCPECRMAKFERHVCVSMEGV